MRSEVARGVVVAWFDLATGILPGAGIREYGSRTSTEARGHRRGARCIGSTVLRAPEVLVRCGAVAPRAGARRTRVRRDDAPRWRPGYRCRPVARLGCG